MPRLFLRQIFLIALLLLHVPRHIDRDMGSYLRTCKAVG